MLAKLLVTIGIAFYAVVVPVFEINASHVFNPQWTPLARLHEVWQLTTNCALRPSALVLVQERDPPEQPGNPVRHRRLPRRLRPAQAVLRRLHGPVSDGSEKLILGINLGLFAYSLAILLAVIAGPIDRQKHRA